MNLVLPALLRSRAEQLIHATARDGADATTDLLARFPADAYPALIAYLARVAVEARSLPQPAALCRVSPGCPDRLNEAQRREAHRRYKNGHRSPDVVAGEREYQRTNARKRRART